MKFTLTTFVAIIGVASAISVDAGLVKRQCVSKVGDTCGTRPCCSGLTCQPVAGSSQSTCVKEIAKRDENHLSGRSEKKSARLQTRRYPEIPADEPRWG
ncbi:uncharacterized protein CTRU02_206354 [Colletotrichum truncatum]|uniref:Uncharacterized protein n=1 Tax=Colletotrichum truncatum TaxID=5467 RepID=A0ACC3Z6L2_COLTU|nr:uncharacterized protein CTRU02_09808 [Colletotrichum truncatum]KAF6787995.1 hypothetical protein CTRU02_09808 [Colletotrichum truncatum]